MHLETGAAQVRPTHDALEGAQSYHRALSVPVWRSSVSEAIVQHGHVQSLLATPYLTLFKSYAHDFETTWGF